MLSFRTTWGYVYFLEEISISSSGCELIDINQRTT